MEFKKDRMPDHDRVGCYPPGIVLGATWDKETVYECGTELGNEMYAFGTDVVLGTPNVNLHRDPKAGRLFEGYSEDPFLVSELAPEFVKGVQASGVLANVKHYAGNNQETWRMGVKEEIPVRVLRELYLPGFEACIKEGKCKTLMTAYNCVNGEACSANTYLIQDVLRKEWGFDGLVMSDWNGVYDRVASLKAENDLNMPGPVSIKSLEDAYAQGNLSMETIDQSARRVLEALLDMPIMKGRKQVKVDLDKAMAAAYRSAVEGTILLKNEDVLPLSTTSKVSFFGEHSKKLFTCGDGSAEVETHRNTNPYDSTVGIIGEENVAYQHVSENTDAIIVTVAEIGQEGSDRKSLELSDVEKKNIEAAINAGKEYHKPVIAILNIAGPVELMPYINDLDAVLCVFLPGMGGGQAVADIIFGNAEPGGRLPITFPKYYKDCPTYGNFPGEYGKVVYGEGLFVGYRYYDTKGIEPLYPFGYGLSYTTFEITDMQLPESVDFSEADEHYIDICVKNTGKRAGKAVVQLYIEDVVAHLLRPKKELKGFAKVYLEVGEEKKVRIKLTSRSFAFYDTSLNSWVVEPGEFVLHAGFSSADIKMSRVLRVGAEAPYPVNEASSVEDVMLNIVAVKMLQDIIPELDMVEEMKPIIFFSPNKTFEEFWSDTVVKSLVNCTNEEIAERLGQIHSGFEYINHTGVWEGINH